MSWPFCLGLAIGHGWECWLVGWAARIPPQLSGIQQSRAEQMATWETHALAPSRLHKAQAGQKQRKVEELDILVFRISPGCLLFTSGR